MNSIAESLLEDVAVYVISVRSFRGRQRHFEIQAEKCGIDFEYIFEFDELGETDRQLVSPTITDNAASCVLKHFEAQRRFLDSNKRIGLIFEDDAIFLENFEASLGELISRCRSLPEGWLTFLGGADNRLDSRFFSPHVDYLIEKPMSTAEAYMTDRLAVQKRLDFLAVNRIDRPADHQLTLMDKQLGISQYWCRDPLVSQGSITGMFPTELDLSRRKHSLRYISLRYRYNRLRKQLIPRFIHTAKKNLGRMVSKIFKVRL